MIQILLNLLILITLHMCSCSPALVSNHQMLSDTIQIKRDMDSIVMTTGFRNHRNPMVLNQVAEYIRGQFLTVSDSVSRQTFTANGTEYSNIICSINTGKKERIIIGAHYDVCGDQDGADDNASGVVGMLQLARLLKKAPLNYRIDFVAYTLEEPPYFGTEQMGSHVHARYLSDHKIPVKGMISLEMIGYFSDAPHSQEYPVGALKLKYGHVGDYITIVTKFGNGSFGTNLTNAMQKENLVKTQSFTGPESLAGIDFSDHRNYWKYGYSAVMITNTAFYRNKNYHEETDKIATIDFKRLALTVDELYLALTKMK